MYMYVHKCTLWTFSTSVDEQLRLAGSDCINISVVVNCKIVVNRKILRITNMGHSMPNHLNFKIAPYVSWTPVGRILVPTSRSFLRYMYDPLKNHTLPPFPHSKLFWWPCLPFLRPTYISKMHINLKIDTQGEWHPFCFICLHTRCTYMYVFQTRTDQWAPFWGPWSGCECGPTETMVFGLYLSTQ